MSVSGRDSRNTFCSQEISVSVEADASGLFDSSSSWPCFSPSCDQRHWDQFLAVSSSRPSNYSRSSSSWPSVAIVVLVWRWRMCVCVCVYFSAVGRGRSSCLDFLRFNSDDGLPETETTKQLQRCIVPVSCLYWAKQPSSRTGEKEGQAKKNFVRKFHRTLTTVEAFTLLSYTSYQTKSC